MTSRLRLTQCDAQRICDLLTLIMTIRCNDAIIQAYRNRHPSLRNLDGR